MTIIKYKQFNKTKLISYSPINNNKAQQKENESTASRLDFICDKIKLFNYYLAHELHIIYIKNNKYARYITINDTKQPLNRTINNKNDQMFIHTCICNAN